VGEHDLASDVTGLHGGVRLGGSGARRGEVDGQLQPARAVQLDELAQVRGAALTTGAPDPILLDRAVVGDRSDIRVTS
jgi:hypothetical protein